jgi:hypothetical protein
MAMTPRVVVGGLAIALAAALSACQGGSADTADPSPPATSLPSSASPDPTSPTPSPTSVSPTDDASAQAVALVPTYLKTIDDLFLQPTLSLNLLHDVAVTPELTIEASGIAKFRGRGYRQTGRTKLVKATVGRVDLTIRQAASRTAKVPKVLVRACVDVSGVQAIDKAGKSVVPANRPKYLLERLTITNVDYPDPSGWRVSHAPNTQAASCDG